MKKSVIIGITSFLVFGLIWYLFFKKYDYVVTFKDKTAPGTIFQGALDWGDGLKKSDSIESKIVSKMAFSTIVQELKTEQSTIVFNWFFEGVNDSITGVKVGVIDSNNSIVNRIMLPFSSEGVKQFSINKVVSFKNSLDKHLAKHKVKINTASNIPAQFCAYIPIESSLQSKGQHMIAINSYIMGFLQKNNLEVVGRPFIEVNYWDIQNQKIKYNFCFPIEELEMLPYHKEIKFKKISAKKALKATYKGNYRTSDRAWFLLYDYALRNNIKIENKPFEIFYNNPFMGGNELDWKAEIFMPIIE